MLQLIDVKKVYKTAGQDVHALKGINLRFRKNEFVSILGASGCGKTTMLNIIGGLDHYTSGDLVINGKSTKTYKDQDWDVYRNHRIGFVFQSYNLIPHQSVLGNVEIALTIAGVPKAERKRRATEALKKVGLEKELKKRPNQLSGGQMQRVAIARALVNNPEILLADEPTGALDTETSVQIMDLIREIAGERLVIMVTHNPELAEEYSSRIVRLQDGLVLSDSNPYEGETTQNEPPMVEVNEDKDEEEYKKACLEEIEKTLEKFAKKGKTPTEKQMKKATKKAEKKVKKAKKTATKREKKAEKAKRESSAMSFKTSLGLSARNLAMKKGRTAVTSVAGSIGIISVCLVLALSNGFNSYILKTQEDMLSSSPLEITETTIDMAAIMTGMNSASDMPDLSQIGDKVYVNSFLTNIAQGMTVTNDLSKEYLDYIESMDKEWYTAIAYDTGMALNDSLFTEVEVEVEGQTTQTVMSLSELKAYYTLKLTQQEQKYASLAYLVDYLGSIYGKMPGTSDVTSADFGKYVQTQYELVGNKGHFPTKANEAVLVIGGNNDMTDLTLAQLGFIGEEEFLSLFPQGADAEKPKDFMIPFDKIIGKQFMLNHNDAIYTPAANSSKYVYEYSGSRASLDVDPAKGTAVTITGILRLKEDLNYGCLGTSGLFLTEQLYTEHLQANKNSQIANTLRAQALISQQFNFYWQQLAAAKDTPLYEQKVQEFTTFLMNNLQYFKVVAPNLEEGYMSGASMAGEGSAGADFLKNVYFLYNGDKVIRQVGGLDTVNSIAIYTDTFNAKEQIINHLDAWNNTHPTEKQVKYTDTIGMMMSMVEMMLNAITYVLVAFTAISLVVSSVMIGIITYVSVVERVKEIGVLRSLGARKKDIKNLFNAETFIIGLASGVFGVVVTYLLSIGINALLGNLTGITTLASLPVLSAVIMVVISIGLTLISGLIPANAAAKKDPVVALRTE